MRVLNAFFWVAASFWVAGFWGLSRPFALAAQGTPSFTAEVDRTEISQDESVALKLTVEVEGGQAVIDEPRFSAPDFQEVNSYQNTFVQSFYENGSFGMRDTRKITKVLRPLNAGELKITGISITINGKTYAADSISVRVNPPGSASPPPKGYGGSLGLRGASKPSPSKSFFVRAEINKSKVYKGEQVVVSYYLYQRARLSNLEVVKYPVLGGFLREDLAIPVLRGPMEFESVNVDGVVYQRALLARYAAYPLREGVLKIDSMTLRANYYAGGAQPGIPGMPEMDDPFFQFFSQQMPQTSTQTSDPVTVQVQKLPAAPPEFSGGVGDFSVTAAVDRTELGAGEPVTLLIKVEGRGNIAGIELPKLSLPEGVSLFESKGRAKSGSAGIGEKIFEYVLIPRRAGKLTLPAATLSYFDPVQEQYVSKSSDPVEILVTGASLPNESAPQSQGNPASTAEAPAASKPLADIRYLKPPRDGTDGSPGLGRHSWWRWTYWLTTAGFVCFVGIVLLDFLRGRRGGFLRKNAGRKRAGTEVKSAQERLRAAAGLPLDRACVEIEDVLFQALESVVGQSVRSYSRAEIAERLQREPGWSESLWRRIERLLEFLDQIRFASGSRSDEATLRKELEKQCQEAARVLETLARPAASSTDL